MTDEPKAIKTSRRDLPFVIAQGGCGGTTVAATMIIAGLAGIEVVSLDGALGSSQSSSA